MNPDFDKLIFKDPIIFGFTGTRVGMTSDQLEIISTILNFVVVMEFHHGDCVGADQQADAIACTRYHDIRIKIHPPENPRYRAYCQKIHFRKGLHEVLPEKPYLGRNSDIVDACDVLIAAPRTVGEELRSGTWATVRYARKIGKMIMLVYPDGTYKFENWKKPE